MDHPLALPNLDEFVGHAGMRGGDRRLVVRAIEVETRLDTAKRVEHIQAIFGHGDHRESAALRKD